MKKVDFDMKKVLVIIKTELKMRLKSMIIWCSALAAIMFMYMLMFPYVKDIAVEKMTSMPPELLELFGMSNTTDYSNYNAYFASILQVFLIFISAYAVSIAANIIHNEESTGTIEFLYSCNVSRLEIYIAKIMVIVINLLAVLFVISLSTIIGGFIVANDSIDVQAIKSTLAISFFTVLDFAFIGFLAATLCKKNLKASNVGLGVMMGTYLIGYVSNIGPEFMSFLKWFSPIDFCSAATVMSSSSGIGTEQFNVFGIILSLIIILGTSATGYFVYSKKDF